MGLWGGQKGFDQNGDGKLGFFEYNDWYFSQYGHDMEMAARRRRAAQQQDYDGQINELVQILEENYRMLNTHLRELLKQSEADDMSAKLVLYEMSSAAIAFQTLHGPAEDMVQLFLSRHAELGTADALLSAVRAGTPLFEAECVLTKDRCGSAWQHLIACLPPHRWGISCQETVDWVLGCTWTYFSGLSGKGEDEKTALEYDFHEYFQGHWQCSTILYPDVQAAIDAIRRQDFSEVPEAYRDLLVGSFPEIGARWDYEGLNTALLRDIYLDLYERDPALCIKMWRLLLDTAATHLQTPAVAEQLIRDDMETICCECDATPVLDELERDEHFARQVFQSAYVGYAQEDLLKLCTAQKRESLYEHLLALLNASPFPRESWSLVPEAPEDEEEEDDLPPGDDMHDGQTSRYCLVRFANAARSYAYLTEDESIQAGDWVAAPFGRDHLVRTGQVEQVNICTAAAAPYPPERTKKIQSKVDAPVGKG